jgi:Na+/H+ antiporter NhaD/arsenite permease-like protein
MLLIRPFMRINRGRLTPAHVVFFIFIVSNCGGCLTPIGDPPLYLGYLKGVPFLWTLKNLWYDWDLRCRHPAHCLCDLRLPCHAPR